MLVFARGQCYKSQVKQRVLIDINLCEGTLADRVGRRNGG